MTKFLLITLTLMGPMLSQQAFASEQAQSVYAALNVPEVNPCRGNTCPNAETVLQKSVGGLTCRETTSMVRGYPQSYECSSNLNLNGQAVYNALAVEEVNACSGNCPNSVTTMLKIAGNLTCLKTTTMSPSSPTSFACQMKF